ncbi:HAMP domain-containing histidine kinase [Polyangium aurulentum]|uniref:HAMP domain-containing histidine kinase n=1 Tax=Polyangium aurulentum TaxID=2567896 RepID=UPI00146F7C0D|nr:HAMP domain-containing histidine kinase [Polyangium aurulentum]UQA62438.1 sensor histidine kinase [Polyangium aurulentum]
MTSDRLTRNELAWLLAQEARSAAQKLRQGVMIQQGPPESVRPAAIDPENPAAVESMLNQLDEAVGMLASLHGQAATSRGRRGKIDVAALLWEVAPEARVQIEMGDGTTVFGDETELRRMIHVLVGQAGDPANAKGTAEVSVRRDKTEVKVSVVLGPDQSATFETERAWLSRMAVRYGGRLELDGAMQTLVLPADVDMQRQELENLKRELKAAQEQGEAYARELAAVFARTDGSGKHTTTSRPPGSASIDPVSSEGLVVLVAGVRGLVSELRGIFSAITRDLTPLRDRKGEVGEIVASAMRHVTAASETMADLARLGACPVGELPRHADLAEALRDVVRDDMGRAARHDVRVTLHAPQTAYEVVPIGALTVLLHALLDHAISASPPGSEVVVTLDENAGGGWAMAFDDAGPPLSEAARAGVLSRDFEVLAAGRPAGISLIAATAVAAHARIPLEIEDAPTGGARVRLVVPKLVAG